MMNYPTNFGRVGIREAITRYPCFSVDEPFTGKLSTRFLELCKQAQDELYLSLVTPWEMQIKQQIGKLKIASPIAEMLEKNQQINRIQLLPIALEHILALDQLPLHHGDPFDRLLIAQSMVENMALVTADEKIRRYDVDVVW